MEATFEYDNTWEQVTKPKTVRSDCSAMLFVNKGTEPVMVNNMPLAQNESFSTADFRIDIDRSQYSITFGTGGGTQMLHVVRKKYRHINYAKR